jgi:hypothetical protein
MGSVATESSGKLLIYFGQLPQIGNRHGLSEVSLTPLVKERECLVLPSVGFPPEIQVRPGIEAIPLPGSYLEVRPYDLSTGFTEFRIGQDPSHYLDDGVEDHTGRRPLVAGDEKPGKSGLERGLVVP